MLFTSPRIHKATVMNLGDQEESPWDGSSCQSFYLPGPELTHHVDVPSSSKPSTPLPTNNGDPLAQAARKYSTYSTKRHVETNIREAATGPKPESPRATVTTNAPSKTPGGRGTRKRVPAPQVTLEAADDPLAGPLGGASVEVAQEALDEPPELPQKEQRPVQTASPTVARPARRPIPAGQDDDGALPRPGSQQGQPGSAGGTRQPQSISIEQASKPSFNITVGDPHKVGDFAGSHTVYQVRTKVRQFPSRKQSARLT